jgi:hypothetical protein
MNFYKLTKLMEQNPITPIAPITPVSASGTASIGGNPSQSAADIVKARNQQQQDARNKQKQSQAGVQLKKTFDNLKGLLKQVGVNVN